MSTLRIQLVTGPAAGRVCLLALLLTFGGGLATRATAQMLHPPQDPVAAVVDFLELYRDGYFELLWPLGRDPMLVEYELYRRVSRGTDAVKARLRDWSLQGVWIEAEPVAVLAGGQLVVTDERVWADYIPEDQAPWRYTVTYLLAGGRIVAITRVLEPATRDGLAAEAIVGDWGSMQVVFGFRFGADGRFRWSDTVRTLDTRTLDTGSFEIASSGLLRWVSDEATVVCAPGDEGSWRVVFLDADTVELARVEEDCVDRTAPPVELRRLERP